MGEWPQNNVAQDSLCDTSKNICRSIAIIGQHFTEREYDFEPNDLAR